MLRLRFIYVNSKQGSCESNSDLYWTISQLFTFLLQRFREELRGDVSEKSCMFSSPNLSRFTQLLTNTRGEIAKIDAYSRERATINEVYIEVHQQYTRGGFV